MKNYLLLLFGTLGSLVFACKEVPSKQGNTQERSVSIETVSNTKPRNVIFILADDHRFDFLGFTGKVPWLKTPHFDRMAKEGAYGVNTFVTTALCSPSRASILTGLYSHTHTVVDNQAPVPENLIFFPQYLQKRGYQTAFLGKWHMGEESNQPRPGFDHWESFKGQGVYYNPVLNINGKEVAYTDSTYITDLLTEHAVDWLTKRDKDKPFFLYLSHKAVHAEFQPAKRHQNTYQQEKIAYPESFNTPLYGIAQKPTQTKERPPLTQQEYYGQNRMPDWVKSQRESWHGVDYMYHGALDFEQFYKQYCETLLGVDESVGKVLQYLDENNLAESTLVIYMGDNGFSFGEHGLIDKRHFYEESVKVPLLVRCPELVKGGQTITQMLQNIDIAPTILDVAGIKKPANMPGQSFVPILKGENISWRDKIFYEYYWEFDFPQTPTMHGVRTDRYKYIRYHGVWDTNELYDLQEDPHEMHNLIASEEHQPLIKQLNTEIYDWLEKTNGLQIPLKRTEHPHNDHRNKGTY